MACSEARVRSTWVEIGTLNLDATSSYDPRSLPAGVCGVTKSDLPLYSRALSLPRRSSVSNGYTAGYVGFGHSGVVYSATHCRQAERNDSIPNLAAFDLGRFHCLEIKMFL